jgi:prolyl oligopeptidase
VNAPVLRAAGRGLLIALALAAASTAAFAQAPTMTDPYAYMEEIEGAKALDFARTENARSLPILQNDPRYQTFYDQALAIATATDRIPAAAFHGDGTLRNFWQDATHVRGLLRSTDLASYKTASPQWKTILDLDAVAKAESKNWVFKGVNCLAPDDRLCLIDLSDGGKDAVTTREFDVATGQFVSGGFVSPEAKQSAAWLDKDTVLLATDWGPHSMTESSYPFILKAWTRGTPLSAAKLVYQGTEKDLGVDPFVLRDADGKVQAWGASRALNFYDFETWLMTDKGLTKLPLPLRANISGLIDGQMLVSLKADWPEQGFKEGDLISIDLAAFKANPGKVKPVLVLRPSLAQGGVDVSTTRNKLVISLLENVTSKVYIYSHGPKGWSHKAMDLPANSSIGVDSASEQDDKMLLTVTGYLTPTTQVLADAATGKHETLRTLPARFDASKDVVEQNWATSKDGTKIPYFIVRPKAMKLDGTNPTLLYAYGGFENSETPAYSGIRGKLWTERGGVFVDANIRGGGEFGPRWHNAGLKLNRMRVYEDFFAVSQDLIDRKITSPRRLGIMGGSNGGLLMGVALTQHPELYRAIVIQVPLFDMLNYTHIGAGASWIGEYGDPAIPAERAVIETYSPYQNLKAGQPYPEVYIETSTKDDRVHPAHARKAAAKLKELGYPFLYYENIDGGHAAGANLIETARRSALEYIYLTQKLMD